MTLQRSKTLDLVQAVEAARARGLPAHSLSTPSFPERGSYIDKIPSSTLLFPAAGHDGLRTRCREVLFDKWNLANHQTVVTAGAKAAILATFRACCEPGDRVLIVAPTWPSYADIARLLYLEPRYFETRFEEGFAIDPDALGRAIDSCRARVVVICNPNNPTGRIVPGPELEAVSRVARERGVVLLLDESFSGVIFDAERWRGSLCASHEGLVLVGSISKSHHLQGLRIGACMAEGILLESIVSAHQGMLSSAPSVSQSVAYALLAEHEAPETGSARAMAVAAVEERGWASAPSEGTFYLFPRVNDIDAFEADARARNVFLLKGGAFGETYSDHFRLCFCKSKDEFGRILDALGPPQDQFRVTA